MGRNSLRSYLIPRMEISQYFSAIICYWSHILLLQTPWSSPWRCLGSNPWFNWLWFGTRTPGLLFAPSVGPGYEDTGVRPWNGKTTRRRDAGRYYGDAWRAALRSRPHLVSVTSFNEWHEGTQIEPAVPFQRPGLRYNDYAPKVLSTYLNLSLVKIKFS